MCTHEIWTYPECGCTIDHHRSCSDVIDVPTPASCPATSKADADCLGTPTFQSSPLGSGILNNRTVHSNTPMTNSTVHLPPNSSPTPPDSDSDTEDSHPEDYYHSYLHDQTSSKARHDKNATEVDSVPRSKYNNGTGSNTSLRPGRSQASNYDRRCSINHTTYKTFLEPICDDCLLDELGIQQYSESDILPSVIGAHEHSEQTGNEDENDQFEEAEERGRARHSRNGSGLIWSSNVHIEITPSPTSNNGLAEELPSELVDGQNAAFNSPASPVDHTAPGITRLAQSHGSLKRRSHPFTHDPRKRFSSSIDLARQRPRLVKELEAYLDNESGTEYGAPQEHLALSNDGKDGGILESSVEVEVLDDSGLNNALDTHRISPVASSPNSPPYRFPSTHFPHARPPSAIDTTSPAPAAADIPPRHRSTLSASTFNADADDESSLHASSPTPATSDVLSPNVTQRRPKPRSNTNVVRRRGMDISRSSFVLRISSRWGSAERECLKGFKDDLLGRSPKHQEKDEVKGNALNPTPYVALGSEQEHKKDLKRESNETIGAESTSMGKHENEWSSEILKHLSDVQIDQDHTDVKAAEAGDVTDFHPDPAQPAPVKLHRDEDVAASEVSRRAGATPRTGRHRSRSPVKNLLTRIAEAQNGGKTWAKGVLGDLRRSLSRDSRGSGRRGREWAEKHSDLGLNANLTTSSESIVPGVCTLRAVVDSSKDIGQASMDRAQSQASLDTGSIRRASVQTSASVPSRASAQDNLYLHPRASQSFSTSTESWQAHLCHDLTLPRQSKKHSLRKAEMSKSEVRLPTGVAMERHGAALQRRRRNSSAVTMNRNFMSGSSPLLPSAEHEHPLEARYYHQHHTGHDEEESKRRLLSASSGPSIPVTASSTSSRTWFGHDSGSGSGSYSAPGSANLKWKGERLASIVSSSEFENGDELVGNPWNEAKPVELVGANGSSPSDQIVRREGTPTSGMSECAGEDDLKATTASYQITHDTKPPSASHTPDYHQHLPRPRNPTPSSAPTFRFKPHLQSSPTPSKSAQPLTQHPLSTPLRISTPNRPILPLRTSSLSSPPMSTPTRIGLPASKSTLTHSPTENFACIWKRYLCVGVDGQGGCRRIAREEVVSCICGTLGSDAEIEAGTGVRNTEAKDGYETKKLYVREEETLCRSSAPIVRYVEGILGDWKIHIHDTEGLSRRTCEQCRVKA